MFIRKKKYPSGNSGVIVVEKIGGKMKELARTGYWNSPSATARWLNMTKEADVVSWAAKQTTVQRKMPITERREYEGWKRLTSMARLRKVASTKEVTISSYPWMVR